MLLQEKIQNDSIQALKDGRKDDRSVLSTLCSNIKNKAVEKRQNVLDDVDVIGVIQKFLKTLKDEIEAFKKAKRDDKVTLLEHQYNLVKSYLPKMLSEAEIKDVIDALDDKSMKSIMTHFKTNYNGQVDMSKVSKIARNL